MNNILRNCGLAVFGLSGAWLDPCHAGAKNIQQSDMALEDISDLKLMAAKTKTQSLLETVVNSGEFPAVSVAVALNGDIVHTAHAGFAETETRRLPNADTMFRIYSTSKGLTGVLAAVMADNRKIDLDEPITTYLPDLPIPFQKVTSRQLLGHMGGVRHYASNEEWVRLSTQHCTKPVDALAVFIDDPLVAKPGEKNSYTSFGFVLLSAVLEAAGGKPYGELMRTEVFVPSGTSRIELDDPTAPRPENLSRFYEPSDNDPSTQASPARPVDNSCKYGGGGFNASPQALAKIWAAFYAAKLTSEKMLEEALTSNVTSDGKRTGLGFGFDISRPDQNGRRWSAGSGEAVGGRAAVAAYPDDEIVVVLLANAGGRSLRKEAGQIAEEFLIASGGKAWGSED